MEFVNPVEAKMFTTVRNMVSTIMAHLDFGHCSKSIFFDPNFGSFPDGSYAKVSQISYME